MSTTKTPEASRAGAGATGSGAGGAAGLILDPSLAWDELSASELSARDACMWLPIPVLFKSPDGSPALVINAVPRGRYGGDEFEDARLFLCVTDAALRNAR